MKSFLTLKDINPNEIEKLLEIAQNIKNGDNVSQKDFSNKNIALLFETPSTRTRCSFEVAATRHNINTTFLGPEDVHLNVKETIKDTVRVLDRMYDGIAYRGPNQKRLQVIDNFTKIPVWNSLTDKYHPTQTLADLLTIQENIDKDIKDVKVSFIGDCKNNVARSLSKGSEKLDFDLTLIGPEKLLLDKSSINKTTDIAQVEGSDVVYTDTWFSINDDKEKLVEKAKMLKEFQVDKSVMSMAKDNAIFMHCLPAMHNNKTRLAKRIEQELGLKQCEVTNEIFESNKSVVFEQSENKLHTIRALLISSLS